MRPAARRTLMAVMLIAGFAILHYFAPLQPCSVFFDLALVAIAAGFLSIIVPLRFIDICTRKAGAAVLIAGILVAIAALNWPAPLVQSSREPTKLDEFMPAYHVQELHSVRIHARPDRVWNAIETVTFSEVPVIGALMRVRRMASGHFRQAKATDAPILQTMSNPRSAFLPLAEQPGREYVLGLAGRFWGDSGPVKIRTPQEFLAFNSPGSAKAAFNFLIEDMGNGWSRLSTETRGMGTDDQGRRIFARYWRVIYPGSGAIRRMWLNAIKSRAEQGEAAL